MGAKVFLWHQDIHALFGENLFFFALRFGGYRRQMLQDLVKKLSEENGITGVSLYEIFGTYDLLLKVWLTPAVLPTVTETLNNYSSLRACPVFQVDEMKRWPLPERVPRNIWDKMRDQSLNVRDIQDEIRKGQMERALKCVEIHAAALVEVDEENRFFSALSFGKPLEHKEQLFVADTLFSLQEEVNSRGEPVKNVSLYLGQGFAHVLIETASINTVAVRDLMVDWIMHGIAGMFPEMTTFTMCQVNPFESDLIGEDALRKYDTGAPPGWIEAWFPEFVSVSRDEARLRHVQTFLGDHKEAVEALSERHRCEVLRPFLKGILARNPQVAVSTLLPWFAHTEATLGRHSTWFGFLRSLPSTKDKDVKEIDLEIRRELGLLRESKKEATLGDKLNMYVTALKKYYPEPPILIQPVQSAEITQVRNEFAHGAMYEKLDDKWEDVLKLLFWFLPVYEFILRLAESGLTRR